MTGADVSFILPDAHVFGTTAANVMAKFCHFVFFFASRLSRERWVAKHPGTLLALYYLLGYRFEPDLS